MPKSSKTSAHEHDLTKRLVLFVVLVGIVTLGLALVMSKIERPYRADNGQSGKARGIAPVIVGEGGIAKSSCEAEGGYWVECGNPCQGSGEEFCAQVCEPQCLCGGSNNWQCPADFRCADFAKLASDEKDIGVCRTGEPVPVKEEKETVAITEPIREAPEGMICDDLNFICVDESVSGTELSSPFEVSGSGIAFENTINWRLLNGKGRVLAGGHVIADAPDIGQAGEFNIRGFILNVPETTDGTLEVLEYSAKDGEPIHVVKIPVQLQQTTMSIKVFELAPQGAEGTGESFNIPCDSVIASDWNVPRSALPIETSLRFLLTSDELDQGPYTRSAIPKGTELESIVVSNGTAKVVFSPELENFDGGSCNVAAIRAQIEQTLERFSSVQNVEISVSGKTAEETLQP